LREVTGDLPARLARAAAILSRNFARVCRAAVRAGQEQNAAGEGARAMGRQRLGSRLRQEGRHLNALAFRNAEEPLGADWQERALGVFRALLEAREEETS
jgi:hypothetical protein